MRPKQVFFSICVQVSLLLGSAGAYAQDAGPPEPAVPDVELGKSGLSYRYADTFGVTESPYKADNKHFEQPHALAVDANQKVYVLDHAGSRVHQFNKNGIHQWNLGKAGMHYVSQGEDVFNWPRDVGVDGSDNLWVVDSQRVTQYNSSGAYQQVFPKWDDDPWDCGEDNGHFCEPAGIAFDSSGWMYVSDDFNHRVQVFKFTGGEPVYYKTIGQTGNPGNGSDQFNHPGQIVIDSYDNLFVADRNNARIQKCEYNAGTENWTCSTFHGTGSFGSGDDQL